jgi:hypothetical protein
MYGNLELVRDRIAFYTREPDSRYRGSSGWTPEEESITQKLRQYWADDSIPNEVKLLGFEIDLSTFDPRNTSYMELNKIALGLEALGIIDFTTGGVLTKADLEFDSQGNQINKDKKVDIFECLDFQLKHIKAYIAEGHDFANDTLVKLEAGIKVMLALDERAKASRGISLVNVKI